MVLHTPWHLRAQGPGKAPETPLTGGERGSQPPVRGQGRGLGRWAQWTAAPARGPCGKAPSCPALRNLTRGKNHLPCFTCRWRCASLSSWQVSRSRGAQPMRRRGRGGEPAWLCLRSGALTPGLPPLGRRAGASWLWVSPGVDWRGGGTIEASRNVVCSLARDVVRGPLVAQGRRPVPAPLVGFLPGAIGAVAAPDAAAGHCLGSPQSTPLPGFGVGCLLPTSAPCPSPLLPLRFPFLTEGHPWELKPRGGPWL